MHIHPSFCSSLLSLCAGFIYNCFLVSLVFPGHGKFETLGALGISCMLLATAGGIAWHALDLLLVSVTFTLYLIKEWYSYVVTLRFPHGFQD